MDVFNERKALEIVLAAVQQSRTAELLNCLAAGGSATTTRDGELYLASAEQLASMVHHDDE